MDIRIVKNLSNIRDRLQEMSEILDQDIKKHIGQHAILVEKDGKHSFSFFIQITGDCTGKYKCYDYEGKFRCYLTKYIDKILLIVGDQRLIYLDCI